MDGTTESNEQPLSRHLRLFGATKKKENIDQIVDLIEQYDGVKIVLSVEPKIGRLVTVYSAHQECPYLKQLGEFVFKINKESNIGALRKHSAYYEEQLKNSDESNIYYFPGYKEADNIIEDSPGENYKKQRKFKDKSQRSGQYNQNKQIQLSEELVKQLKTLGMQIKNKQNDTNNLLDQNVEDFLTENKQEATLSLVTVDFESFVTYKGGINVPSEMGLVKIQNGGITGTLHYLFKPDKPFSGSDIAQIKRTKQVTGISANGAPNAIQMTIDNVKKVRQDIVDFLGQPDNVILLAKGIEMEKDILFRYFEIDKSYKLMEFANIYNETFKQRPNFSLLHQNRVFDFCKFHESSQAEKHHYHCALDDAFHLAKIFVGKVEEKQNEIEITINGEMYVEEQPKNNQQQRKRHNRRSGNKQNSKQKSNNQSKIQITIEE